MGNIVGVSDGSFMDTFVWLSGYWINSGTLWVMYFCPDLRRIKVFVELRLDSCMDC